MAAVVAAFVVVTGFAGAVVGAAAFVDTGVAAGFVAGAEVGFVVAAEVFDAACVLRDGGAEMTNPKIAKNNKSAKNFIFFQLFNSFQLMTG